MHAGQEPSGQEAAGHIPGQPIPTESYRSPSDGPGARIGAYKLLQQIGEGGFGVVYMAEQEQPVHRRVALKIIKPGMDSTQVIARFEAERQALAMMDHQNIAKVFDAGTTDAGRLYFVMELVHGIPITRYCDDSHLTVRDRLELFVPVCKAIQHAHQKGIIHRDLKPSNVLVCLYDGRPVPKVIDFGVAKATEQRLTERTMFTQYGQIIGTFEYMSPEQAEMSQLGVDTRSDIYSLGVMLYELLTGSTPLERQRLREAGLTEMLKIVKEEEPPKPSTRLSSVQEAARIAAARRSDPVKLAKLLRGDLDWVVMRCLEKDRTRRYDTANGLARDIERYLHDEPVEAGPPGAAYRLRKLARKHRTTVTIAAGFLLLLLLGGGVCAWQAVRATQAENDALAQRDRAEQAKRRAQAGFRLARDTVDRFFTQVGESPQLKSMAMEKFRRDLLQNAKDFYERFIREQPDAPDARQDLGLAHVRLAKIQMALGDYREAETSVTKAVALLEELHREQPDRADYQRDLAACYMVLGDVYRGTSRADKAEQTYRQALAIQDNLAVVHPEMPDIRNDLAGAWFALGDALRHAGKMDAAIAAFEQARAVQERLAKDHSHAAVYRAALVKTQSYLCAMYGVTGKPAEADAAAREAIRIGEAIAQEYPLLPEYQFLLGEAVMAMASRHHHLQRPEQGEADYRRARQIFEKLANEHPDVPEYIGRVGFSSMALGWTLGAQDKREAAQAAYDRAVEATEQALAKEPRNPSWRAQLRNVRIVQAGIVLLTRSYAEAIRQADAIARQEDLDVGNLWNLTMLYAECAAAAGKDDKLPSTERAQLRETYAARAVALLREAMSKGFRDLKLIRDLDTLQALRERDDFNRLVLELEERLKK
jgi:eukaryotic-like serine/threonine-protein kinase